MQRLEINNINLKKTIRPLFILKWFLIIFFAVYTLFPLIWLFVTSFKTNAELFEDPFSLPVKWQIQNYINAIEVSGLDRMMLNSIFVSLIATSLTVFVSSMASYSISRFNFRGKEIIYTGFAAGILVPLNALMVPYFLIVNFVGLYDNMFGLILVYASIGIPISTFLIRGFMNTIPKEIEEAGYIDGCGFFRNFFILIFPLSKTGLVTAAILQFLTCWNEFIYANLLLSSSYNKTLQLGVKYFTNQFTTDYVSMYAAIVITIVPCILAYIIFQKQIISGLTSGAVKG